MLQSLQIRWECVQLLSTIIDPLDEPKMWNLYRNLIVDLLQCIKISHQKQEFHKIKSTLAIIDDFFMICPFVDITRYQDLYDTYVIKYRFIN